MPCHALTIHVNEILQQQRLPVNASHVLPSSEPFNRGREFYGSNIFKRLDNEDGIKLDARLRKYKSSFQDA